MILLWFDIKKSLIVYAKNGLMMQVLGIYIVGLSVFVVATFIPLGDLVSNILLYTSYVLMGIGFINYYTKWSRNKK